MEQVLIFCQTYGIPICGILLLALLAAVCILLHRTRVIRKRMDRIAEEVKRYISYVLESEDGKEAKEAEQRNEAERNAAKRRREEEQSRVISAVLEEIFP